MAIWYNATVVDIEIIAPQVRVFKLQLPEIEVFGFEPGQFVTLDLPIGDKRLERWRSYSIANSPKGDNFISLCISRVPEGRASGYFFDTVVVGTVIKMKGPEGRFVLPQSIDNQRFVMVCTGTGIVPFWSMLQHILVANADAPPALFHLIFGTRTKENIIFRAQLEAYAAQNDWFDYTIALSREQAHGCVQGYVHSVYEQAYAKSIEKTLFYLCGWQNMIDEAQTRLNSMGVDPKNIRVELYG